MPTVFFRPESFMQVCSQMFSLFLRYSCFLLRFLIIIFTLFTVLGFIKIIHHQFIYSTYRAVVTFISHNLGVKFFKSSPLPGLTSYTFWFLIAEGHLLKVRIVAAFQKFNIIVTLSNDFKRGSFEGFEGTQKLYSLAF